MANGLEELPEPNVSLAESLDPQDRQKLESMIRLLYKSKQESASPKKGWFDFTISVQALIIACVVALVSIGGMGINSLMSYNTFQLTINEFKTTTQAQLVTQATMIQTLNDQLNTLRQGNIQLREQLAKWQLDSTAQNLDQQKQLAALDKSIAVLQEQMNQRGRATGPHGELPVPERFGLLKDSALPFLAQTGISMDR